MTRSTHERDKGNAYNISIGKPKRKRPLARPRYRWKDNTKVDLKEIGYKDVNWIHVAQDRVQCLILMNMVMNTWVSYGSKFLEQQSEYQLLQKYSTPWS